MKASHPKKDEDVMVTGVIGDRCERRVKKCTTRPSTWNGWKDIHDYLPSQGTLTAGTQYFRAAAGYGHDRHYRNKTYRSSARLELILRP